MLTVHRRLRKPRRFEYHPRFHDPKEDAKRLRGIRIERTHRTGARKTRQPHFIAVGLGLVLAFYLYVNAEELFGRVVSFGSFLFGA